MKQELDQKTIAGREMSSEIEVAKKSLERNDTRELFDLYEQSIKERGKLLEVMEITYKHFKGTSDAPRYSEDVVGSIERVALAAIELAKNVALTGKSEIRERR